MLGDVHSECLVFRSEVKWSPELSPHTVGGSFGYPYPFILPHALLECWKVTSSRGGSERQTVVFNSRDWSFQKARALIVEPNLEISAWTINDTVSRLQVATKYFSVFPHLSDEPARSYMMGPRDSCLCTVLASIP